jgi:hypothetical protein
LSDGRLTRGIEEEWEPEKVERDCEGEKNKVKR